MAGWSSWAGDQSEWFQKRSATGLVSHGFCSRFDVAWLMLHKVCRGECVVELSRKAGSSGASAGIAWLLFDAQWLTFRHTSPRHHVNIVASATSTRHMVFRTTAGLAWASRTPPRFRPKTPYRYAEEDKGDTLEGPETTSLFAHGVDKKCCHEQADGDTDGDLNHGGCDIEDDGVQTIRGCLSIVR